MNGVSTQILFDLCRTIVKFLELVHKSNYQPMNFEKLLIQILVN